MLKSLRYWKNLKRNAARPFRVGAKLILIIFLALLAAACGKFFPSAGSLVAISISPSNPTIQLNKTQQFTATGTFGDNSSKDISSTASWKSSDTTVATINSTGLATAIKTGTTTITASQSNVSGNTTLTVSTQASGLTVSPATQTISRGQTVQFSATQNGSSVTGVTWTSSSPLVATIDQSGIATGISTGTTTITATATISGNQTQGTAALTVQ